MLIWDDSARGQEILNILKAPGGAFAAAGVRGGGEGDDGSEPSET